MNEFVKGYYFKTGSSTAIDAVLEKNERGFRVLADEQVLNFCAEREIDVSNHLGNAPRKLKFPDGSMMVVENNELMDTWFDHRRKSQFFSKLSFAERSWTLTVLAIIAIPLIFFAFFQFVIPAFAKPIANRIPHDVANELDQYTLDELESYLSETKLSRLNQARVTAAFDLVQSNIHDVKMHLYLRDGGDFISANAFALPGGSVVMTDQVLEAKLTIPEMTAVFAHEAGHVYHKHGLQQLVKVSSVGITLTLLLNDLSAISQTLLVGGGTLLQTMSYSREAEREADEFSYSILNDLGISPACFGRAIEKLGAFHEAQLLAEKSQENDDIPSEDPRSEHENDNVDNSLVNTLLSWLSTHPSDEERINASSGVCISD